VILGLDGGDIATAILVGAVAAVAVGIARRRQADRRSSAVRFGVIWAAVNLAGSALRQALGPAFESIMVPITAIGTIALVLAVFWIETKPIRQEPGSRGDS